MSQYKFTLDRIADNLSELDVTILNLLKAFNQTPVKGKTLFQKELFLIAKYDDSIWDDTDFIPHIYGPYSEPVENSANNLVALGLIKEQNNSYSLTEQGQKIIQEFHKERPKDILEAIEDFKLFLNDLTQDELLLFIYVSYPDFAKESTVYDRVLANRIKNAKLLYTKDKVSLKKAAFLAGLFNRKIFRRGSQLMKIFDTSSVVCILKEIGYTKILDQCLLSNYQISIPKEVYEELQEEEETIKKFEEYGKFLIIDYSNKKCMNKLQNRYPMLHSGEISVLCNSLATRDEGIKDRCIIDEKEARKLAKILPVLITGTVGLIKWHKENGRLSVDECIDIHSRISKSGFRVSKEILNEIIK